MAIPASLRQQIVRRAQNRCEYCGLAQEGQEAAFHVDHVIPLYAGGATVLANLALACVSCSLRKGARQSAADPRTGKLVRIFDPRRDSWRLHFRWDSFRVAGISPMGRATVEALSLNRVVAQTIREQEAHFGRHPPPRHL